MCQTERVALEFLEPMDVIERETKGLSLEVLIGIFEDIYKKCFNFYYEAPEIELVLYHVFFSIIKACRFFKTPRLRILRTSAQTNSHCLSNNFLNDTKLHLIRQL